MEVPLKTDLTFEFGGRIDFAKTEGRTIRLYAVGESDKPVWQADPDETNAAQGKQRLVFDDLPRLKPNTTYYLLADQGWIRFGGKPKGLLNDGAYWYRFRTGGE